MPSKTFFNLKETKKKKIVDAIRKEIEKSTVSYISVKNIVTETKISRGSFYQYFETKEDAINYVIIEDFKKQCELYEYYAKQYDKNPFKAIYEYVSTIIDEEMKNVKYHLNRYQYMREKRIITFQNTINIDEISKYIDEKKLNIKSDEEKMAAIRLFVSAAISTELSIISGNVTKEEGMKMFQMQLEIINKGVCNN